MESPHPEMSPRGSLRGERAAPLLAAPTPCPAGGEDGLSDSKRRPGRCPLETRKPGGGGARADAGSGETQPGDCCLSHLVTTRRLLSSPWDLRSHSHIPHNLPCCSRPVPQADAPFELFSFHPDCGFAPSSTANVNGDRAYLAYSFTEALAMKSSSFDK